MSKPSTADRTQPKGTISLRRHDAAETARAPRPASEMWRAAVALLMAVAAALLLPAAAQATTFTVANTENSGEGSLRDAIAAANADPGHATIEFASGVSGTIELRSAVEELSEDVTIEGPGAETLTVRRADATDTFNPPSFRIFTVASGVTAEISGLTIENGRIFSGGAIFNSGVLTIRDSVVQGNTATTGSGGGILNLGTATVVGTTVRDNTVEEDGSAGGGGLRNGSGSTLVLLDSTVNGNAAESNSGPGGIASGAATSLLTVRNSTISGNEAKGSHSSAVGGVRAGNDAVIENSTIAGNTSPEGIANLLVSGIGATATVSSTIIAEPPSGRPNCGFFNVTDSIDSDGYNLADDDSCQFDAPTDQPDTDPQLGPLADNGGSTETMALPATSPAIDQGTSGGLATDQRGFARPVVFPDIPNAAGGDGADIGAFELGPEIALDPASLDFGSQLVGAESAPQEVEVENVGQAPLTVGEIGLTGDDPGDFVFSGDCTEGPVAPNASCTVAVRFAPAATGAKAAELEIASDAPGSPHAVTLSGTGVAPVPAFDPSSIAFGGIPVGGASDPLSVAVANTGSAPLSIASVSLAGPDAGEFSVNFDGCSNQTLPPDGTTCNVNVALVPSSPGGKQARLDFASNAPGSPHSVALSGAGTVPWLSLDPASLAFGAIPVGDASEPLSAAARNVGSAPLSIQGVTLAGPDAGEFSVNFDGCTSQTLPPGSSTCNVNVSLLPSSEGAKQARLDFESNAPGSPHSVALSGTGAAANLPAKLQINRARIRGSRLVVRGSLDPRAAGERLVLRFRASGRQLVLRPIVRENGRIVVNRRLRGPQRGVRAGRLLVRFPGNDALRAAAQRVRATVGRSVALRIRRVQMRGNRLVVAGQVVARARGQARVLVEFNHANGDPAQVAGRAKVNRRGRFRTRLRIPPAARDLGGWVSIAHPGRARIYGQRLGRGVGGQG